MEAFVRSRYLMGRCARAQDHSKTERRIEQGKVHVLLRQSCIFVLIGMSARSAQQAGSHRRRVE
jgi:hypothetical protein